MWQANYGKKNSLLVSGTHDTLKFFSYQNLCNAPLMLNNYIKNTLFLKEVKNSRVTRPSDETEWHKMTSHVELRTRKFL